MHVHVHVVFVGLVLLFTGTYGSILGSKKRPYCRREGSWRASDKGEGSWRPPGGRQGEGSRRASDGGEASWRASG